MNNTHIIIKPLITEQSVAEASRGKYTFLVGKYATKTEIKNEIDRLFNVHVKKVFTNNVKEVRVRYTKIGKRVEDLSYKKARVQVKSGEKIDIFEQQGSEEKKESK